MSKSRCYQVAVKFIGRGFFFCGGPLGHHCIIICIHHHMPRLPECLAPLPYDIIWIARGALARSTCAYSSGSA
jgi:hypothetical protein